MKAIGYFLAMGTGGAIAGIMGVIVCAFLYLYFVPNAEGKQ